MSDRLARLWIDHFKGRAGALDAAVRELQAYGAAPHTLAELLSVAATGGQGGEGVARLLVSYYQALQTKDFNAAATKGNEWLKVLRDQGASPDTLTGLQTTMLSVITELQKVAVYGGGGNDFGAKGEDSADAIDWYEPDPEQFYVLDANSGAALERTLEKLRMAEALARRKARVPNRLLFIGLPGNGKTAGAKWLAAQLGLPAALIRIDGVVGAKVGETARRLRAAFEEAKKRQGVLIIDELDAVSVNRGDKNPNVGQWDKQTTTALNQLLDSLDPTQVVIGCTNVPEAIDPSVLRRMRTHIQFGPPDRAAREAMLTEWWSAAPYSENAWKRLIEGSEGQSGDFLERVAEEANSSAALRGEDEKITAQDVSVALATALATTRAIAVASTVANGSLGALPVVPVKVLTSGMPSASAEASL